MFVELVAGVVLLSIYFYRHRKVDKSTQTDDVKILDEMFDRMQIVEPISPNSISLDDYFDFSILNGNNYLTVSSPTASLSRSDSS